MGEVFDDENLDPEVERELTFDPEVLWELDEPNFEEVDDPRKLVWGLE